MQRRIITVAVVAMLTAAPPVTAQSAPPGKLATVAIIDFEDGGSFGRDAANLTNLGKGIGAALASHLVGGGVEVIEREQIQAVIAEYKLALSGMLDQQTAVEIGRLIGVDYLVFGTYTDVSSHLRIDARLVEVATGRLSATAGLDDDRERVFRTVGRIASQLLAEAKFEMNGAANRAPHAPGVQVPSAAILLFSEGLAHEDRGEREKAAEMYAKALDIFPDYAAARQRLERIRR